jgi:hypothetical protein
VVSVLFATRIRERVNALTKSLAPRLTLYDFASFDHGSSSAPSSALHTTAASGECENSRPIAAPICANSLARPSRSSRATNDACKLAGTAEEGIKAAVRRASSRP